MRRRFRCSRPAWSTTAIPRRSESRPRNAAYELVPITATPDGTRMTSTTPSTARAADVVELDDLPAECRAARDGGEQHVRQAYVEAEDGRAGDLGG